MIYKIKNISGSDINYGKLNIPNNTFYIIYNDTTNYVGYSIENFKDSFKQIDGINYHLNNNLVEFYVNDDIKTTDMFYSFWYNFNKIYDNIKGEIKNTMLVINPTIEQINNSLETTSMIVSETYYDGTNSYYYALLTPIDNTASTSYFGDCCVFTNDELSIIKSSKYFNPDSDVEIFKLYMFLSEDSKKNYKYPHIVPKSIDYKKDLMKRLYPKYTFNKGILVLCEYFEKIHTYYDSYGLEQIEYFNPILKCEFEYYTTYYRDVNFRICRRYWQTLDNQYSNEYKEQIKYYTPEKAREEGTVRRKNIIDRLVVTIVGLIIMTEASINTTTEAEDSVMSFFDLLCPLIDKYIKGNINPLITELSTINVSVYEAGTNNLGNWIDNIIPNTSITIRQYSMSVLSEGLLETNMCIKI